RSKPGASALPQTPQGTVILLPERFSRKAIVGACWMPCVFLLLVLSVAVPHVGIGAHTQPGDTHVVPTNDVVVPDVEISAHVGPRWWQILLAVLTLPLGFSAPFGTTILGWLAVSDIRR